MCVNSPVTRCCERSKIDLLGTIDEISRLAWAFPPEARDLATCADEAAQGRRLPHDPRVVRGVRGRWDEGRELVQPDPAADVLELAPLLQLVRERDRVHRLALRVEREGGAVDLRVGLPVEVPCVEDLADGADRPGGEHHRPEDRLLGLEVLRRDGCAVGNGSELRHAC